MLAVLMLTLAGIIVLIRSGLQRVSDDAVARFPGDRAEALTQVVDCEACALADRNRAVWALGQMTEVRALPVLRKYYDAQPCNHSARLCQYELRKAIRMIQAPNPSGHLMRRLAARFHRPWR